MFRLNNKTKKSKQHKISLKRLQFLLALKRFVTYTFLSARGVAQLGSATALGAVGRWFESSHPDHFFFLLYPCGGSSIGRASAFQADCCGFESRPPLHLIPYLFNSLPFPLSRYSFAHFDWVIVNWLSSIRFSNCDFVSSHFSWMYSPLFVISYFWLIKLNINTFIFILMDT